MTIKTDITELTAEKLEEIRQRYRPTEVPKCHICGAEMTIQRASASRITYGCTGATYDEQGCHYAEGRSIADDHYAESRITVVDVSDPDVLALVEALEKAQKMETYWKTQCRGITDHCEELQERIADLESRTVKLPHLPDDCDRADANFYYMKALDAAGIKWEAE
ncbi:TPA: ead/Ea22-like family protein [Klebsiella pneumoniae]